MNGREVSPINSKAKFSAVSHVIDEESDEAVGYSNYISRRFWVIINNQFINNNLIKPYKAIDTGKRLIIKTLLLRSWWYISFIYEI